MLSKLKDEIKDNIIACLIVGTDDERVLAYKHVLSMIGRIEKNGF